MIDFSDHNAVFLNTDAFGQIVSYVRRGFAAVSIGGVFENIDEQNLNLAGGAQFEATSPRVLVKSSDVPYIAHRDTFVINGKTYTVIGLSADTGGITTVQLSEETDA